MYSCADKSLVGARRKQATFPAFYWIWRFITTFTRVNHLYLHYPNKFIPLPITLLTGAACFLPCRAKDLSTPQYNTIVCPTINSTSVSSQEREIFKVICVKTSTLTCYYKIFSPSPSKCPLNPPVTAVCTGWYIHIYIYGHGACTLLSHQWKLQHLWKDKHLSMHDKTSLHILFYISSNVLTFRFQYVM